MRDERGNRPAAVLGTRGGRERVESELPIPAGQQMQRYPATSGTILLVPVRSPGAEERLKCGVKAAYVKYNVIEEASFKKKICSEHSTVK
jgi:hypothetical protein